MVLTAGYGPPEMPENAIDFDESIDWIGTTDQIAQEVLAYLGRPILVR